MSRRKDRRLRFESLETRTLLAASDILSKLGYDIRPLAAGYKDLLEAGFVPAKIEPTEK